MGSAFSSPRYTRPRVPGGRLTLATGVPVMATEQAAKTVIYYTPYIGDSVFLYDGTGWVARTFTELSINLAASANWAADKNFDVYVVDDGGTLRLVTGAAWTDGTTRAESLTMVNGFYTNNASMTGRYGASSTMTVAANRGLYVGTFRASANGTTTWELGGSAAGGDPVVLYVWNAFHRVGVRAQVFDSTSSWTYATATIRAANAGHASGGVNNRASYVCGLAEDSVAASYCNFPSAAGGVSAQIGIGVSSTSAFTGTMAYSASATSSENEMTGSYCGTPGIGYRYLQAVERASGATITFYGLNSGIFQTGLSFDGRF